VLSIIGKRTILGIENSFITVALSLSYWPCLFFCLLALDSKRFGGHLSTSHCTDNSEVAIAKAIISSLRPSEQRRKKQVSKTKSLLPRFILQVHNLAPNHSHKIEFPGLMLPQRHSSKFHYISSPFRVRSTHDN
jgi:hypothetical protein